MEEKDILYENGDFWVCREDYGTGRLKPKTKGYAIYQNGITHSKQVSIIGYEGETGLKIAIAKTNELASK